MGHSFVLLTRTPVMACAVHTRVMSHPQIHGTSQSTGNTVVSAIITVVAIICVALRFYVRVHMKAGVGADDWWILAGLLSFLLTAGLLLWSTLADCISLPNSPANTFQAPMQTRSPSA